MKKRQKVGQGRDNIEKLVEGQTVRQAATSIYSLTQLRNKRI